MKFIKAFHKADFDGVQQTIGLDPYGQIWLMNGETDASGYGGHTYGQFAAADALRFACELFNLAVEGVRIQYGVDNPES